MALCLDVGQQGGKAGRASRLSVSTGEPAMRGAVLCAGPPWRSTQCPLHSPTLLMACLVPSAPPGY